MELNIVADLSHYPGIGPDADDMHLMPAIRQTPSRLQHHSSRAAVCDEVGMKVDDLQSLVRLNQRH